MKVYTLFDGDINNHSYNKYDKTLHVFKDIIWRMNSGLKITELYINSTHLDFGFNFIDVKIKYLFCDSECKIPFIIKE